MPMIEPAIVIGISNAKLLKKALGEYRAIVNELIDAVRQIEGSNVPEDFHIPEPQVIEDSSPARSTASRRPASGASMRRSSPNIGVSDKVAVLSASHDHTERLLKADAAGGRRRAGRGRASAGGRRLVRLGRAGRGRRALGRFRRRADDGRQGRRRAQRKPITDQVHTALDVLKVLRTVTSESYLEDGVLVTTRWRKSATWGSSARVDS